MGGRGMRFFGWQVLVATDVAARGLDVVTLAQAINFDMPTNMEDYIHRIGRTARAGNKGESHTYFHPEQARARPDCTCCRFPAPSKLVPPP